MGRVSAGAFFIHQDGFTVLQHDTKDFARLTASLHHNEKTSKGAELINVRSHSYRVHFLDGAIEPQIVADKPLNNHNNYFIGSDPSKWASNCNIYQGVTVKNIYPNIDIRYYSGSGTVKYDLIVHPGGNPNKIALKYDGTEGLEVKNKELLIKTSVGELKELNPYTYQYNQAGRVSIAAKYTVKNGIVKFDVKDYDTKTTLVIDPDLIFCSFSGSTVDNWGFTATYGPDGSMYGGGISFGQGFPVSPGAYQTTFGGGERDISIIKLSPDGVNRIYATYIGGSGNEQPHSLIVDPQGELVIAGRSNSANYPTKGASGQEGKGGGFDIVVTKLSADGATIIGSKKIGGTNDDGVNISVTESQTSLFRNYGDNGRSEVILDAAGNVYVASCTQSTTSVAGDLFPTKNGFQNSPVQSAKQDGVVIKLDPTVSTLLFSSFLGGSGDDAAYVLAINPLTGNVYVAGGTASGDLPGSTAGTVGVANNLFNNAPSIDGFVSIITPAGVQLKTTYLGTNAIDQIYGIQFDDKGFPYVMGQTLGSWPLINAAWSQPNGRQFIAKLKDDLSAYVYSTVFGTNQASPNISPVAFLVDRCENVYISGWGAKIGNFSNAGVLGLTVTPDAIKSTPDLGSSGAGEDFYFFVLKRDAVSQLYGSFFGQNNGAFPDHVDGGTSRFDKDGVIYQAICASCESTVPFPTTPGVWAPTKPPTAGCNLAMVKIAFNLAGVKGDVQPSINGVPRDSVGCVPLTVDFTDSIQQATQYEWNFDDGTPSVSTTVPTISHTFNIVRSYNVRMIAIDLSKCIPRDTSYVIVKVGDNKALPDFNAVKLSPPCDIFRYRFDNISIAPATVPFRSQSFIWDFGDGSPRITTGPAPVFHTYANAGTYKVKLFVNDTSFCNSPDSIVKDIRVAANVKAIFKTPPAGCSPYNASFENRSDGGSQFIWDFGDGTSTVTTSSNPIHTYNNPGTYTIKLTAIDSNTCNIIDSSVFTITVNPLPTADFSATPPQVNTPVSFTNLSSADAIRFKWVFGDGDSLLTTSRNTFQHEFNFTKTYTTCLTAYNRFECAAELCRPVENRVEPAIDVPNAFTPLSADNNNKVFVRGFGISKLNFAIYARWGEKVFETADKRIGWDGRYKGQLLPMDAYAYTLDVELVDGRKVRKTGDITLIR